MSFWTKRNVFVTGATGFVGAHLTKTLVEQGTNVICLQRDAVRSDALDLFNLRQRVTVIQGALEDYNLMERILNEYEIDAVFHLAAQADVRVSVADPALDAAINVLGTIRVLEGARQAGAAKVVFAASGGTLYGEPDASALPLRETQERNPGSPYGVSKMTGIDYLDCYQRLHGQDYAALALANVFGPRQDPHGEAGVVAIFAGRLLAGEPCTVFGTGEQTRDFVYVTDVADAFVRAGDRGSGVMNIGTGVETSVNTLYRAMAAAAGGPPDPVLAAARPGELDRSALDSSRAREQLDWSPQVDLQTGVQAVIDWSRRPD